MYEYVEAVSMEGPLEKKGKFKTWAWTKYWFVLDEDQLCYYRDSQRNSAQGLIDLGQAECVRVVQNVNHGFPFEIVMKLDKCHVLSAGSEDDQTRWVKKLQHAMMLSWRRSMSMQRPSCDSLSDDDELIVDFKRLMSVGGGQQHQQGCLDDDVFHNNNNSPAETPRRSRFPKYRTRVGSSEDELEERRPEKRVGRSSRTPGVALEEWRPVRSGKSPDPVTAQASSPHVTGSPGKPPPVPKRPGKLPTDGLGLSPPGSGSPLSPRSKSPGVRTTGSASPGVKIRNPKPTRTKSPGPALTNSPTPPDKKKPPPVSPKPQKTNNLFICNGPNAAPKSSVATRAPVVVRKSAPLVEDNKLVVAKDLAERKRSSSMSAAQDSGDQSDLRQVAEISKANSIITDQNGTAVKEDKVTYSISIFRKRPARTDTLTSCNDLDDISFEEGTGKGGDDVDLDNISVASSSEYIARDSLTLESSMMKQWKKSHFHIDADSLPDYAKKSQDDDVTSSDSGFASSATSSIQNSKSDDLSPTKERRFSKNSGAASSPAQHNKIGLRRSNARRTKTPPSPTVIRRKQHKSYDPVALRARESRDNAGMWRHSEAPVNANAEGDESSSSDSECENEYEHIWEFATGRKPRHSHVSKTAKDASLDLNFNFPAIPALPNPRLEMRFDSPVDLIRRFLATNRGPNEIFPVPRKSERGGKAMSKLKLILRRLDPQTA